MNAVIEAFEVPVSNDEIKAEIRELRADNKKLNEKIDVVAGTLIAAQIALHDKVDEGFRAADAKIDALRNKMDEGFRAADTKIDALRNRMDEGFRAADTKLEQKCTGLSAAQAALRDKMDEGFRAANAKIDAVDTKLGEKLTTLSNDVADMRGLQKAMLWVIGGLGSLAMLLITAGKALHWF
ncbi:MAG TPA: hypothetical protein VHC20_03335 [Candidatus Paceibacterota bacterium]|nr:hypothetical protein [Candidatus Paceibacterota bacterium]